MTGYSEPAAHDALALIVVNYASAGLLDANLPDGDDKARIVVVDNFSSVAERHQVAALCAERNWVLVPMPDNRGFGAAVNAGARRAAELGCTELLLVNPDARVPAALCAQVHQQLRREPGTLVSPRIADSSGRIVFQGVELMLRDGTMRRRSVPDATSTEAANAAFGESVNEPATTQLWLTGACLGVSTAAFEQIGGFDERYFLYWEDVDFSYRAARAGLRLQVRDDLLAVHDEGGTQSGRRGAAKSLLYYHYNCRNRLLFAAANLDDADQRRWLLHTPAASWEILLRGGRRQLLHSWRPGWAAVRGTLAGLRVYAASGGRRTRRDRARPSDASRAYS